MSRADTEAKIAGIIVAHLGCEPGEVVPEAQFQPVEKLFDKIRRSSRGDPAAPDLGADSLDMVELVMAYEDEFGVEITDDEAEAIVTVKDVADLVDGKLEARAVAESLDG